MSAEEVDLFVSKGYSPASFLCRKDRTHGGTGILIKQNMSYNKIHFGNCCEKLYSEVCCIKLVEQNMFVISLYRSNLGDTESFLTGLN